MNSKKQNQSPLFAEVKLTGDEVRQQAAHRDYKQRGQRVPYIKLGKNGADCYSKNGNAVTVGYM